MSDIFFPATLHLRLNACCMHGHFLGQGIRGTGGNILLSPHITFAFLALTAAATTTEYIARRAHDLKLSGVLQVGLVIWFPISVYTMSDNRNIHVEGNVKVLSEMRAFISWPSLSLKYGPCRGDVC